MKNIILFLVLMVFGTFSSKAQCDTVIVENAIDCSINITIEAYDCNGFLVESVNATLNPGNWPLNQTINKVPVTNNIWCDCSTGCHKTYKIKFAGIDVTGQEICCPGCGGSCAPNCCAVFDYTCFQGKIKFTSSKPGRCP